ncbi:DNA-binding protein [Oceanospirillum linum]|uniref:KfrA N-terminal DNA-binding domain-containing protein n=1 Tax=Oceanospirillum linum TaxID=966 RepID=A0A1T1HAR8_OCELI|nr:DNA-binding protein [Oceanospirillum linum]OOV86915.1 hypothetical protein BTA35_0211520 [Oceanospirillum linum]SEG18941.1 replication region DNA-binding N-term [Oleiphilus messinensis]SMP24129.1 replication region DNA-binding N-term [Oceanospirillum linum]
MARNGISYNDVKQAIDEMQSEGLNPTIAGLRERLGTGSFTTISEHLKHWRAERQQKPMIAGGVPAPDNLNSMVQAVWQQAREDATKELESYKQEIQRTLDKAEAEKQNAIEQSLATEKRNKWLEDKNEALLRETRLLEKQAGITETKLEKSLDEKEKLSQILEHTQKELNTQKEKLQTLSERYDEKVSHLTETLTSKNEQLHSDLCDALSQFELQLNEERKRSTDSEQYWIRQIDDLRQQLKERDQRLELQEKKQQELSESSLASSKTIMLTLKQVQQYISEQVSEASAGRKAIQKLSTELTHIRTTNTAHIDNTDKKLERLEAAFDNSMSKLHQQLKAAQTIHVKEKQNR